MKLSGREKTEVLSKRSVGYFSGFGGLEVKEIEYGVSDTVLFVVGAWTGSKDAFRAVIRYDASGEPYFVYRGYHVRFDEIIRM